ncbi:amidase [Scopulibacillus cellulosilyticus]|uniref:Amidase n=1 Tax=Scopulibacillus cellulosilyticus TaxID=2665665 RepID=A0ABW2PXE8_9BACL
MEKLNQKGKMNSKELWNWTAVELAHGIKTRLISSREAVLSSLNRIQEVNPHINALVDVSAKEALAAADEADRKAAEGNPLGPLHGVPVSIKVNIDQKGHATTNGLVDLRDNIASKDNPVVANLRKGGAVFVGRSNTPAFSFRWFTDNDCHGKTLNPWHAEKTPGGSSGGAAASVATGMVPIAHGNDIGGSIRYPAYACGVAGLRPTVGRIPSWNDSDQQDKPLSNQLMSVQGPLARTISDLRLAFDSMIGFDPRDPVSMPAPLKEEPLKRPIRVGLLRDVGVARPNEAVNKALDEAAVRLRSAGYIVEEG